MEDNSSTPDVTAVDLFAGAGGLTYGFLQGGIEVVAALDSWHTAAETYRLNFSHPIVTADAADLAPEEFCYTIGLEPSSVDIVAGGPPCQGFSIQRIGFDEDERNDLILRFAQYVSAIRPRLFLMENVPGLLGKRGRAYLERFTLCMRESGFEVRTIRVNAADYGVPQKRKRVFVYGWPIGQAAFPFPRPLYRQADHVSVDEALSGILPPPCDFTPAEGDPLHRRMRLSERNLERLRLIPPGHGFESLPVEMRVDCHKNGADRIGHRAVYGRLDPDRPAGTITARFDSFTRGRFAHPHEDRNISLREGARLQTFPDSFRFVGTQEEIAAQIGNAVPPALAQVIGAAMKQYFLSVKGGHSPRGAAKDQLDIFSLRSTERSYV